MRALLAALALSIAVPFIAPVSAAAGQAPSSDKTALARQIMDVAEPDDRALALEMRGWEAGIRVSLEADPAIAKLEGEHPGTIEAGISAGRPIATKYLTRAVSKMKSVKADMLAKALTAEELTHFLDFARSPAGERFFRGIQDNADPEGLVKGMKERVAETGDATITMADAGKAEKKALDGAKETLSAADTLAIMKFEQSAAARKLTELNPQITKAMLDLANSPDPEWMQEQHKAMTDAMIAFVEARLAGR